jgi:hypothetical protein
MKDAESDHNVRVVLSCCAVRQAGELGSWSGRSIQDLDELVPGVLVEA